MKARFTKYALQQQVIKDNFQQGDSYEQYQYFYHPDHLGSSSFITNIEGEVVQHVEYVPYGEVFIEERNNVWNTPYLFNAKEFDEETGLYYYGARYYDSRLSMWYGVDVLTEKYPNIGGYVYCAGNPVKLVDPDGNKIKGFSVNDNGEIECNSDVATSDAQDIYSHALKTEMGKSAFVDMINSATDISLSYCDDNDDFNGITLGEGSIDGLYEKATILISKTAINNDVSPKRDKSRFESLEEGVIATIVHESVHLTKEQIEIDRVCSSIVESTRGRRKRQMLYYISEHNTMNKEYNAVKEYRQTMGIDSTRGYDRYGATKDYRHISKPDYTNPESYANIMNSLKHFK